LICDGATLLLRNHYGTDHDLLSWPKNGRETSSLSPG
jgi:hypothetical protein